jgi:hypothetical protein
MAMNNDAIEVRSSGSSSSLQKPTFNMLKTSQKQHATTLSKALLTAGLLGGAAFSSLGAGSAQAAWDLHEPLGYQCTIGGAFACDFTGTDPTPTPVARPGSGLYPEDKILTLLPTTDLGTSNSHVNDTIAFTKQADSWEVSYDPSIDLSSTINPIGNLDYKIVITDLNYFFNTATLGANIGGTGAPYIITKKFYTDATYLTEIFSPGLSIAPPNPPVTGSIGGQTIFVRDAWDLTGSGATINTIDNDFTQTNVPAPLPILGVGAAFGSIRKLRKFSSQLKTFSMG